MTAQRGKDLLLKLDRDGTGLFVTVAGLRAKELSFNSETIETTDSQSAGRWRELLSNAGTRTATVTGSGIFKDADSDAFVRQYFFDEIIRDWQIIVPDFGTITGPFQIGQLDYSGTHNEELTFAMTLQSAGALQFAVL